MTRHAIVECSSPLQDRGTVVQVGDSLLVSFGMIQGSVVAYGVINDPVTNRVYYLIEHAITDLKVGDGARIRTTITR